MPRSSKALVRTTDLFGVYWSIEIEWGILARSETQKWGSEVRFRDGPGFREQRGPPRCGRHQNPNRFEQTGRGRLLGKVCEPDLLRSPLERDDRQVSPTSMVADFKVESGSGLTADESLRSGAPGSSRPPRARFEPWRAAGGSPLAVALVGGSAVKPSVGPVAVVPGDIERQFLFDGRETVRNHD